jgi:hypothetical protein
LQLCNVYCNTKRCQDIAHPACPHIAQAITKNPPENQGSDTIVCTTGCAGKTPSVAYCLDANGDQILDSTGNPIANLVSSCDPADLGCYAHSSLTFCQACGHIGEEPCQTNCPGDAPYCVEGAISPLGNACL